MDSLILLAIIVITAGAGLSAGAQGSKAKAETETKSGSSRGGRIDAQQLVREVVQNELNSGTNDPSLWRFRKITVKDGKKQMYDVIETKDGEVDRLLAVNGKPLSAAQRSAENARIQKLSADPDEQKKRADAEKHDGDQETQLLKMLPDALTYQYAGKRGDIIRLTFKPNPNFHASTHEAEVFHHMAGVMLINKRSKRLAELSGRLVTEVKFGGGILGHLDKGGTFEVKQGEVARGHWDLTLLDTELAGKELFFKTISVREKTIESNYSRVPSNITVEQAAQILRKDKTESAAMPSKKNAAN
ncbi:MAG: hypothetical protein ACYDCM_13490 [Candidatus Acidiferrales bacterium]